VSAAVLPEDEEVRLDQRARAEADIGRAGEEGQQVTPQQRAVEGADEAQQHRLVRQRGAGVTTWTPSSSSWRSPSSGSASSSSMVVTSSTLMGMAI